MNLEMATRPLYKLASGAVITPGSVGSPGVWGLLIASVKLGAQQSAQAGGAGIA